MIRYCCDIPRIFHRYLLEGVSNTTHLKVKLVKRFLQFYTTLVNCDKPHLKYLARIQKSDYRSVFGRNVRNICEEAQVEHISEVSLTNITYAEIPAEDEWRIPLLNELFEIRASRLVSILSEKELEKLIFEVTSM